MKNKPNFFFDNRGFPNWGGGPPLGNFSHIIPFFSLTTFLKVQQTQQPTLNLKENTSFQGLLTPKLYKQ